MFAAVERLSRVVGCAFSKSQIQEALLKASLNEDVAVNLLLDGEVEAATSDQEVSFDESFNTSFVCDYSRTLNKDAGSSDCELTLSSSESSDDEVVVVDSWPKKLGQLIIHGFLTVNCNSALSVGTPVSLGTKCLTFGSVPQGSGKFSHLRDKGRNIVRIYLNDLEIGRVLGDSSTFLAPLLSARLIRARGRVSNVSSSLRRNEHLSVHTYIYVFKEAFENHRTNESAELQQCLIQLLYALGLCSMQDSPSFYIPALPKHETVQSSSRYRRGWITHLRPYQEVAVKWMLNRESFQDFSDPLWEEIKTGDGFSFFLNRALSCVSLHAPPSSSVVRGGILADEMGLGKTVESIALIAESSPQKEERRRQGINGTLIIVPLSLLNQWLDELDSHVEEDTFEILPFYGSTKSQFQFSILEYDIVLTTYGTLCAEFKRQNSSPLFNGEWYRVILDEAHIIKDRNTQTAKACFALNSARRWLLTGTPIQNSLDDFFSFIHFLKAYPYAEYKFWVQHILKPHSYKPSSLERQRAEYAIHSLIRNFLLRRTKNTPDEDGKPIVSLPERRVKVMRLEPFEEEKRIYSSLYAHSKSTFDLLMSENRLLANFATVLELILRLRQCCDHPDLVLQSATARLVDLSSADKFADTVQRIFLHSDNARFSQSSEYLSTVIERIKKTFLKGDDLECPICLDMVDDGVMFCSCGHVTCKECVLAMLQRRNSVPCPLCRVPVTKNVILPLPMKDTAAVNVNSSHCVWQKSCKIVALISELKAIERCRMGSGDYEGLKTVGKTVIFSQWTRYLDILELALQDNGLHYVRLDGKLTCKQRSKVLSSFRLDQSDPMSSANILLVSLKAGGVGLNLTSASQVFILDPWWNPAVEEQAIDRVHRIGQTKTVIVKRMIVANSIEENLLKVQEKKKLVADSTLGSTEVSKQSRQITVEDLTMLFQD